MSKEKLVLTITQIQKSDQVKAWFSQLLGHKVFAAVLDALQREALPTAATPPQVPGVHHDTTLAHDDRYRAGWSDAINALRKIPTGEPLPPPIEEEELWTDNPLITELDADIAAAEKAQRTRNRRR